MSNTSPAFFRRFEVFGLIQNILEPIHVTLGFSGPVDRESGMIINLVDIDAWISEFKEHGLRSYRHQWEFIRFARAYFEKQTHLKATHIRFDFLERSVRFEDSNVFFVWQRPVLVRDGRKKWKSSVTLTMKLKSEKWPPLSPLSERTLVKKMNSIDLKKMKWQLSGFKFSSLVYFDPHLGCEVKIG